MVQCLSGGSHLDIVAVLQIDKTISSPSAFKPIIMIKDNRLYPRTGKITYARQSFPHHAQRGESTPRGGGASVANVIFELGKLHHTTTTTADLCRPMQHIQPSTIYYPGNIKSHFNYTFSIGILRHNARKRRRPCRPRQQAVARNDPFNSRQSTDCAPPAARRLGSRPKSALQVPSQGQCD